MNYKLHHLNCGSFCPHGAKSLLGIDHLCCHCILVELDKSLLLIDTGLSDLFINKANYFLKSFFSRPQFNPQQSALRQIQNLGYNSEDVTDIIATHLDSDHVGALHDFPNARLHLHMNEFALTQSIPTKWQKRFDSDYWKNVKEFATYDHFGEDWYGFKGVRDLKNLPPEILLIPLTGHTQGHSGVAIQTQDGWLLHAGDSFFLKEDLSESPAHKNIVSEIFQTGIAMDNHQRVQNQKNLGLLKNQNPEVHIVNSHDPRFL